MNKKIRFKTFEALEEFTNKIGLNYILLQILEIEVEFGYSSKLSNKAKERLLYWWNNFKMDKEPDLKNFCIAYVLLWHLKKLALKELKQQNKLKKV